MEEYLKELSKVYVKTGSYDKTNVKLIESYQKDRSQKNRDKILIQNIWLLNYITEKFIKRNEINSTWKEDIFGNSIVYFYELLDSYHNSFKFSRYIYYGVVQRLNRDLSSRSVNIDRQHDIDEFEGTLSEITLDTQDFNIEFKKISEKVLTDRERLIVNEVFYKNTSLEEIGYNLGLTRERARQILEKSLNKLRNSYVTRNQLCKYLG